ncbi:NAD(P)-dependent oxidoreductase [Nocardia brasiliensis]|uniref:NAD(P)-dependent oxidoreductase n=1 Tax=Nocardia brasiliensis TaxID=37326 RepID=UPI001892FF67|nr:NAD(P)H-binding protein [Nocardia brasiliensis]MBF6542122.1 NAD(P)H-binding protein [Nocardia brasiliensis]
MRITVFGAAGDVGSRVVAEALTRGHEVLAVVRDPAKAAAVPAAAEVRVGDASNLDDVVSLSAGRDLVITATRPPAGQEHELPALTSVLLTALAHVGVRLLVVGGASTLRVPGADGVTLHETPDFPAELRPIAQACAEQFMLVRAEEVADWTYLSPPAELVPGERTGIYRLGADELIARADGVSTISMEDFAVALLDEAERPAHRRARFTVSAV